MCKKTSIYLAVLITLVFVFGCTNEPLINGLIYKAHAQYPYPTTTSPTSDPCTDPCAPGCPNANTCACNPAYCTPSPTATATVSPTATPVPGCTTDADCLGDPSVCKSGFCDGG